MRFLSGASRILRGKRGKPFAAQCVGEKVPVDEEPKTRVGKDVQGRTVPGSPSEGAEEADKLVAPWRTRVDPDKAR